MLLRVIVNRMALDQSNFDGNHNEKTYSFQILGFGGGKQKDNPNYFSFFINNVNSDFSVNWYEMRTVCIILFC